MKETIKKLLIVVLLIASVTLLTGCQSDENKENNLDDLTKVDRNVQEGYETYNTSDGIAFDYPKEWISLGTEEMPMFVAADGTGTSVNLTKEEILSTITTSGYVELAKEKIKQQMKVEGDITTEEINLNGTDAYKLSYSAEDEENELVMNIVQTVIRNEDTMYILTTGALQEHYEAQKDIVNNVSNSIRVQK